MYQGSRGWFCRTSGKTESSQGLGDRGGVALMVRRRKTVACGPAGGGGRRPVYTPRRTVAGGDSDGHALAHGATHREDPGQGNARAGSPERRAKEAPAWPVPVVYGAGVVRW